MAAADLRLAVDDTGSGWSSLQHILRLAPDIIKLDRALIANIDVDPGRRALVTSMATFAAETGALVVAEGIERPEELTALCAMGVRYGQGYLLGSPSLDPLALGVEPAALDTLQGLAPVPAAGGDARRPATTPDMTTVFRQSPSHHLLLAPDLRILDATDGYLAVTMTRRTDIVGRHLFEVFPDNPDDGDATGVRNLAASLDRVRYRRAPDVMAVQRYDVRRPAEQGGGFEPRYWSPRNVPVLSEQGAVVAIIHQVDDVTELVRLRAGAPPPVGAGEPGATEAAQPGLRIATTIEERLYQRGLLLEQANERLRELDRLKSDFLGRMSHELRTPLNAILGFGQLLQLESLTPDQEEATEHIVRAGRHLLDLINEVLDIARIESGSINLSIEPVQVRDALATAVGLAAPLAERAGVRIDVSPVPPERFAAADRQRLLQVLLNLLSNAIKYNRPGGSVSVASTAEHGTVQLRVRDEGHGIDPAVRSRLFLPFDRLGKEQSDIEGTGVGLALARGLAERMGGTLELEHSDERGSTFVIDLPVAEPPARPLPTEPAAGVVDLRDEPAAATVLYIEDNASNIRLVEAALRRLAGVRLITAMHGRLGLELAMAQQPDLVLLDLHLPDLDGEQVLGLLRSDAATAATPVVVLSADATAGHVERLLAAGADDYLTKPIELDRLLAAVRRHTRSGPGGGRALRRRRDVAR
ncbi:MAG: EAL domain-containing protein [Acidimicrobiales bacterium]